MPDNLYPPFDSDSGALIVPRQLLRWIDVNPQGGALGRAQLYITLPTFGPIVPISSVVDIVAAFNIEAPNNFVFSANASPVTTLGRTSYLAGLTIANPNYIMCVMWKDDDGDVARYQLWNGVGESRPLTYPLYTGQLIKKNCRLEVWSLGGASVQELTGGLLMTSVLQNIDYRYAVDEPLKGNDGLVTNFACHYTQYAGNYPVIGGLQARWLGATLVTGQSWNSQEGNNYHLNGFSTIQRPELAFPNVANIHNSGSALLTNITPAHIFFLVYFPGNGNGALYSFGGFIQALTSVGPGSTVTITLEDGNSANVPLNQWVIVEVGYTGGNSFVRYIPIANEPAYTPPTLTASTTTPSAQASMTLDGAGCVYYLADIEIFNTVITGGIAQALMNYFYLRYNINFALPLVFPSNSSPQPNL